MEAVGIALVPADSEEDSVTLDEIKQVWFQLSGEMSVEVMNRYNEQKVGSGGHEGLGIYGTYQGTIAKKKVQIAVKLLRQNGFELTVSNIFRVTRQSRSIIQRYLPAHIHKTHEPQRLDNASDGQLAEVIPIKPS